MAVSGALDVICTAISRVISIRIGTSVFGPAGHHHRRLADWALFALHSLVLFLHFDSFYNSYILLICFFYLKLLLLIYLFVYKTGEIHLSSNTFLDRRFPFNFIYVVCVYIHIHLFPPNLYNQFNFGQVSSGSHDFFHVVTQIIDNPQKVGARRLDGGRPHYLEVCVCNMSGRAYVYIRCTVCPYVVSHGIA